MDTDFYFSAKGRVSRKDYWLRFVLVSIGVVIAAIVVLGGLAYLLGQAGGILAGLVAVPLYIALLWAGVCVSAKRFHDRDMSGWWVLWFILIGLGINIVQYAGMAALGGDSAAGAIVALVTGLAALAVSIVQLVILGFLPGVRGPNQYGEDPLSPGGAAEAFS